LIDEEMLCSLALIMGTGERDQMHRHEHFNLRLHSDDELEGFVQALIVERVTLHEWPLSCVQQLTIADGRKMIYKSQFGPTVEAEFYARARSDLLPGVETIYQSDGHVCMLMEFVDAPLIEELDLTEKEVVRAGRAVMEQINSISGDLPHYVDVSSEEKWRLLVEGTLRTLRDLVDNGMFSLVDEAVIRSLERWAFSGSVLSAIGTQPGYVHGDLHGDNLFVLPEGYGLIDWQRPRLGPRALDLVSLLMGLGFSPARYVDEGVVGIYHFLHIHWFAQCKARWIPEATSYDGAILELASRIEEL
jgi:hypothetical protein